MKSLQLDKPHAVIVIGIQGSGKTFFASKFSDTFNAPYVQQSAINGLASDQAHARTLVDMMLGELLKTKQSVVLEVETATRVQRAELAKKLKQAGYTPLLVWVQVDAETAALRSQKTSGVSAEEHQKSVARFTAPHAGEQVLVISGKHTYASQAKIVLKRLSAPRTAAVQRSTPVRGQIIVR